MRMIFAQAGPSSCSRRSGSAASASTSAANSAPIARRSVVALRHRPPALRTVLAQELPSASACISPASCRPEPIDAFQQRLVLAKRLVVAELLQRGQAGGLDVVIVRLVEQDLARLLLQLLRVQANAMPRLRSAGSRATPSCRAAPSRTAAPPWRRPRAAAAPRASRRRSVAS